MYADIYACMYMLIYMRTHIYMYICILKYMHTLCCVNRSTGRPWSGLPSQRRTKRVATGIYEQHTCIHIHTYVYIYTYNMRTVWCKQVHKAILEWVPPSPRHTKRVETGLWAAAGQQTSHARPSELRTTCVAGNNTRALIYVRMYVCFVHTCAFMYM